MARQQYLCSWLESTERTQVWLAERLGVSKQRLFWWVNGRTVPSLDTRRRIARLSRGAVPVRSWTEAA